MNGVWQLHAPPPPFMIGCLSDYQSRDAASPTSFAGANPRTDLPAVYRLSSCTHQFWEEIYYQGGCKTECKASIATKIVVDSAIKVYNRDEWECAPGRLTGIAHCNRSNRGTAGAMTILRRHGGRGIIPISFLDLTAYSFPDSVTACSKFGAE